MTIDTSVVARIAEAAFGPGHRVSNPGLMEDGHAGLTYGFDVTDQEGNIRSVVLKVGPAGVRRSGSTDVFRQYHLLNILHDAGLPVPRALFGSPDEEIIGTPFILMERLAGRTFLVWEPSQSFSLVPIETIWHQAADALAGLHGIDCRVLLADWQTPVSLAGEIERWAQLLRHCPDPGWAEAAQSLCSRLVGNMPPDDRLTLVHGDYQPGNLLFDGDRLCGIIDWDLATLAHPGLDVGWLMMMSDRSAWSPDFEPRTTCSPQVLLKRYIMAGGTPPTHIKWFQAFAHFRMIAIAGLNLKLHRDGRRIDHFWERFAVSVPPLLSSADILLRSGVHS